MTTAQLPEWSPEQIGHTVAPGDRYGVDFECVSMGLWGKQHGPIYSVTRANYLMVGRCGGCGHTVIRPVASRTRNASQQKLYAWARWMYVIEEEP